MSAELLISKLDKVKQTGPGRWVACCPAREDKHPSMTIRELDDGRILIHDFGGSTVNEILDAIGMDISDLFPPRQTYCKPERRPFPASDVLRAIAFEALVVASTGVNMLAGNFTGNDRERLILATERIQAGLKAAGVHRG